MSLLSPDQAAARQSTPALVGASDVAPGERAVAAPPRRRSIGIAGRLLLLTIGFVLLAMGLFYASRLTAYRENWLRDRLMVAHTAMMLFGATGEEPAPPELADKILDSVGAKSIVVALPDGRRLVAAPENAPPYALTCFKARVFWLGKQPFTPGRRYRLKLATQEVECQLDKLERVIDA